MFMFKKYFNKFIIVISILFFIFLSVYILKDVPVFADGTQHVWITKYVYENLKLPKFDITGTQPTNLNIPLSINNNLPFIYQPLFYLITGYVSLITKNPELSLNFVNIFSLIGASILLYFSIKKITDKQTAIIGFLLIIFNASNLWFVVHRLIDPFILFLFQLTLFLVIKIAYEKNKKKSLIFLILLLITLASLVYTKISTIPIILAAFVFLLFTINIKKILFSSLLFGLLIFPLFLFNYSRTGSIFSLQTGVNKIDKYFSNAWWNQEKKEWENDLDKNVNTQKIRRMTYGQFTEIQISPKKLFEKRGVFGVLNQFSLYPIVDFSTEGYQSKIPSELNNFFGLLIIIFIIYIFKNHKLLTNKVIFFIIPLYVFVILFWFKQPTFRYYFYISSLSVIAYSISINYLLKTLSKTFMPITILLILLLIGKDLNTTRERLHLFNYTAMYRPIIDQNGGLRNSIDFGGLIKNTSSKTIFTPMVEICFYSGKRQIWDNRLFFVEDINDLKKYLKNYDFEYVVLPFYSGINNLKNWQYYNGIPSDSVFYELINDTEYFEMVEKNNAFTAYKRI